MAGSCGAPTVYKGKDKTVLLLLLNPSDGSSPTYLGKC